MIFGRMFYLEGLPSVRMRCATSDHGEVVVVLLPVYYGCCIAPVLEFGHCFLCACELRQARISASLGQRLLVQWRFFVHKGFAFDEFRVPHNLLGRAGGENKEGEEVPWGVNAIGR